MDYSANLEDALGRATDADRIVGERWYRRMRTITHGHAARLNMTPLQVGAVYACYSINTPWGANLRMVATLLRSRCPYRGTLQSSIDKAEAIMSGADIDATLSPDANRLKVKMFARACSGDYSAVVVDRWAAGVAQGWASCPRAGRPCGKGRKGHACTDVPEGDHYRAIADAYTAVAARHNLEPAMLQAILWVAARKEK